MFKTALSYRKAVSHIIMCTLKKYTSWDWPPITIPITEAIIQTASRQEAMQKSHGNMSKQHCLSGAGQTERTETGVLSQ